MMKDQNSSALKSFSSVVEKLAKNKLNRSNAFDNRIIDSVKQVVNCEKQDSDGAWQMYSTGVESCGKVYGFCVDQIYTETIQVLAGLNRSLGDESKENKESKADNEVTENKMKKKVVWNAATLETDEKNLNSDKIDKDDRVDTVFRMITGGLNSTSFAGLLLNNIFTDENLNFTVLDQENKDVEMENLESECNIDIEAQKIDVNGEIFDEISRFKQDDQSHLDRVLVSIEEGNDLFENSVSEDSAPEDFDDKDDFDNIVEIGEFKITQRAPVAMNIEEKLGKIEEFNDYQFVKSRKNDWAGLEYWKKLPKTVEKTKKSKVENKLVLELKPTLKKSQVFEPCKKGTTNYYSSHVLKSQDPNLNLPEDYNFSLKRLTQLFTKPQVCVKLEKDTAKNILIDSNTQDLEENEFIFVDHEEVFETPPLNFVSTSKTVDIHQLKNNIWTCLGKQGTNKENQFDKEKKSNFLNIVDQLPKLVNKTELSNLSVHSCFIAVLHLANEKNLTLRPNGQCDFFIE